MNIYKRACSLILSLLLIFSLFSSTLAVQTYAATNPALSAESKSVNAGEQFTVAVNLANATSVYGGNFTLQYDSDLLAADSYTFGSIVGSHTKNCNLDYQSAGNLIRFTFSGASALTSSGTLVTFTFTAKQSVSGSAALQFTAYKMYDENGSAITSTANGATITISSKPVVSPSVSITNKTVTVGETVSVPVMISNSSDVYGGNFTLQYDSSLLTAESYSFGSIVSGHTKNCNLDYQSAGNLIRVTFSGASAVSSDGTLVTFTFIAKAEGSAALEFTAYKMYDENGISLSTTAINNIISVSAKPVITTYTISFDPNGGVGTPSSQTFLSGESLLLSTNVQPTREGYYFAGWSESPDGSGTKRYYPGGRYTFSKSMTLYATWYENPNGKCGDDAIYTLVRDESSLVISGKAEMWNWNYMDSKLPPWFYDRMLFGELVVENDIQNIGNYAFYDCSNLSSVLMDDSVISIGENAFDSCPSLSNITMSSNIEIIDRFAFSYCSALKSIILPEKVRIINDHAFSGCSSLTNITLPNELTYIGNSAFDDCISMASISMPNNVTRVESDTFANCTSLKNIKLSENLEYIDGYAFVDCTSLTNITIPNSVTGIGAYAFKNCTSLECVTIPSSVTYMAENIFENCNNLTIYGYRNSTAEAYTNDHNIPFVALDAVKLSEISIFSKPSKQTYFVGDSLNTSGLQLKLTYSDGSTETVSSGFTTSGFSSTYAGTKTITVSYEDKTTTFTVTVNTPSISLSSTNKSMTVGGTATLTATTIPSGQTVTWTSSNTGVATVPGGIITANAAGSATISAKFTYNGITYSKTCSVTVSNPVVTISSISVYTSPTKTAYYIGDSLNASGLILKLTYSDGSTETVTSGFTTSGFTSTSAGTKTVTVSYQGKTTTFNVTVNTPSISLSSTSKSMTAGDTATLTATTTPSGQTITWTSSNTSVATVSGGTITAKASGSATITAEFSYNGITYSDNCEVTISSHNHSYTSKITKEATCITDGIKTYTCSCGDSYTVTIPATRHSYDNDCDTTCNVCGVTRSITHAYGAWKTTKAATCTTDGTKERTCSVCGEVDRAVLTKLGHDYEATYTVDKAATCTATGSKSRHCTRCDAKTDVTVISATGHREGAWIVDKGSDCINGGNKHQVCSVCSETIRTETIPAGGHQYTSVVTAPTCTADGYTTHTCTVCGDSYIDGVVKTKGHSYDNDCDTTCNVCGATRSITHAYGSWKTTKAATCTTDGVKERTCSVCGKDETAVLTKLGHDYEADYTVDKAATCTATGSKSRHCTRCDAKTDVTVIPVTEHSYTTSVVKPTCTENGYTSYLCKNCGNSYKANYTISTGHTPGEWIIDKKSDCTHGGTKHQVCSICGETIKTQTIPMAEHKYVDTVTKPTCTTDGFTTHTCSVCGDSYTDHVVKAKGHSEKSTVTKATMTKDGKIVTSCTVCKKTLKTTPIYKASSIKLSGTSYVYNSKVQKPTVTVKNSKGTTLKNGTDYTLTYSSGCVNPGKYAVKVTFKGNYTGTKTLYFNILPGKTSSLTASQSTTSIKATWKAVTGASGYKVTLYNSSGKAVKTVDTTKTTYTFSKLSKGTTYKVRVTAYKTIDSKKVSSSVYTQLTTATKPGTPTFKVTAGSKKATLSWNKQTGATGYVVYMATSKNGKYTKIATVKGNGSVKFTKSGLTKGKTYYFKVAAYETVGGKNIYGSFSSMKYAKIK